MSALASPALGISSSKWQGAVSFQQFSFGDYPLQHYQVGAKMNFRKTQHLGFQAFYTGNQAVGILQFSGLYGRQLFENLNMGIRLNYGQRAIEQYETAHQLSMDIALSSRPVADLYIGAWARHLFQIKGSSLENASLLVSAKYHLNPNFRVYASLFSNIISEVSIGTGFYYRITEILDLKLSYFANQSAFTLGFGLNFDEQWGIHSAAFWQSALGVQPATGAFYQSK
jgi:hypothetical protein